LPLKTLAIALCTALFAGAQHWPQFRGPEGKGLASGKPPVEFTPAKARWKTAVPFGQSSPSVWGDRIFITSGSRTGKELTVAAYDRPTGKLLWQRPVAVEKVEQTHQVASPASATVLADAERIYVYFGSWGLLCYDHEGKEQWSIRLPLPQKLNGSGTSPVLSGENVLLNRDDPGEAYLLAVDRRTGKQAWKQSYGEPSKGPGVSSTSTPALADGEVIVHRASEIVALDAKTGARGWFTRVMSTGVGTPVVAGDTVFVATWNNFGEPEQRVLPPVWDDLLKGDKDGDGALTAAELPETYSVSKRPGLNQGLGEVKLPSKVLLSFLDNDKDEKVSKQEYDKLLGMMQQMTAADHGLLAIKRGGEGDVTATNVLWKHSRNVAEVPTPLLLSGRVYMVTNGGILTCNDAKNGAVIYRGRLGAPGAYFASPVAANGHIYFASGDGMVTIIRDGGTLDIVAHNDLQEPIHATPAIVGDTMYVRTAAHLYAFSTTDTE
jgi:outer membrane protein assembly factor BamB